MFSEEPSTQPLDMTEAEYLAFELASPFKYEYRFGQAFYKMGASRNHSLIKGSLLLLLAEIGDDKDCLVYLSGLRLKVESMAFYAYPDLMLVCGETQLVEGLFDTVLNPLMIVEILSPDTEDLDRGKKFKAYRKIPSFQEYLLVAQDKAHIQQYQRREDGLWELAEYEGLDSKLELRSVKGTLMLADVYQQVSKP